MIGLTKQAVKKILGRAFISCEQLETIVVEVEAMLNDRPLTYVSSDSVPQYHSVCILDYNGLADQTNFFINLLREYDTQIYVLQITISNYLYRLNKL